MDAHDRHCENLVKHFGLCCWEIDFPLLKVLFIVREKTKATFPYPCCWFIIVFVIYEEEEEESRLVE